MNPAGPSDKQGAGPVGAAKPVVPPAGAARPVTRAHPCEVLHGATLAAALPVCDHYCGVQARMLKSLALQAELMQEFGTCVFDVTLDCEDGAPVGGERDHAEMVLALLTGQTPAASPSGGGARVAVRVHPVDHPAFEQDVDIVVGRAAAALCHLMIPKVESVADVDRAARLVDLLAARAGRVAPLPLHVLIESAAAVQQAFQIAAHPRVQSLSFGLMDFVSSHGGAIPASAMGLGGPLDQFTHPLVVRAKLEIAAACHAQGKVPAHGVVTEFANPEAVTMAARHACQALGYTRMWSIHPSQIRPILAVFAPAAHEVELATRILCAAVQADWAPISHAGKLHDRASYRYFWQVLERAYQTGQHLPDEARVYFSGQHEALAAVGGSAS